MAKITVEQVNKKVDLLAEKVADLCKALLPSNDKKEGKTKLPELVEGEAAVGYYKGYKFNDGNVYEIAKADNNGVLVFKEGIFEASFDGTNWDNCSNNWEKSSLKKKLENWWDKNAPAELKENYNVTLLEIYEALPDHMLPEYLRGKGQQLAIFKDWKERLKNLRGEETSTWWWTKTPYRGYANLVYCVTPAGACSDHYAHVSFAVVPACVPIKDAVRNQQGEAAGNPSGVGR